MKAKSLKAGFVLMRALLIFADFSIAAVTDEPRVRNLKAKNKQRVVGDLTKTVTLVNAAKPYD